jgi:hypothetical protein
LKTLLQLWQSASLTFTQVDACIKGWVNHVRYANTWGLRHFLLTNNQITSSPIRQFTDH